ncbi:dUTPase [Listeria floridensis FSL S10-1187]|uniref:dUTP diphosphatase n=1 Tax=Listeria floridensis FSL S10-1187 TaxID=1265817 RepID=A0ABP3AW72_9LIST|nr:dUTPase [Listeria floridensis]EUJ29122.1 dUTPase [Listeria floridensis FSL S10-1187]
MKQRGFEIVTKANRKFADETILLPQRSDAGSAGYDFYSNEDAKIYPGGSHTFFTDVKSYMLDDEVLMVYVRSSMGIKRGLNLSNSTGVIDASYYSNPENDGNIGIALRNIGSEEVVIQKGERIAQGIFTKFLTADTEEVLNESRDGGFGSSGL